MTGSLVSSIQQHTVAFNRGKGLLERLGRITLLDAVCVCVFHMFSLMQYSEVHSNASKSTTWDHQIRMIYSPVLAYTECAVEWSHNNNPRPLSR